MSIVTLASLIGQFETSDLAQRIPVAIKSKIVHELCIEYTKDMTTRIRSVVVNSTIVALQRQNLHAYARVARLAL